ncbi:RN150 protein, partial [Polypterus senegalus]
MEPSLQHGGALKTSRESWTMEFLFTVLLDTMGASKRHCREEQRLFALHPRSAGDIVAIMIPEPKGKEIVMLLERNVTVMMHITIGTRNLQKYVSRTSVVFVSISFIVLMIISLAWLVFYYIQRFRYANARDRNQQFMFSQRRLGDAAKKAISKLQVRTIRKGDKETEPEFDNCAVCIEGYKPNDVVRILPCRPCRGTRETVADEAEVRADSANPSIHSTTFSIFFCLSGLAYLLKDDVYPAQFQMLVEETSFTI